MLVCLTGRCQLPPATLTKRPRGCAGDSTNALLLTQGARASRGVLAYQPHSCCRTYFQVMWKYQEQASFPMSEDEYMAQLDAVAELLTQWGLVSTVRDGILRSSARGPGYTGGGGARAVRPCEAWHLGIRGQAPALSCVWPGVTRAQERPCTALRVSPSTLAAASRGAASALNEGRV